MDESLEAVRRVRTALDAASCTDIEIKMTAETIFTVEDASLAVGAPPEEILKSLVFLVDDRPTLVLMSGANRVDLRAVARAAGGKKVKMAAPDYVLDRFGFRIGGVPPLGYPEPLPAVLDDDLFRHAAVWAAAGTDHAFFPIAPERLLAVTGGTRTMLKKTAAVEEQNSAGKTQTEKIQTQKDGGRGV